MANNNNCKSCEKYMNARNNRFVALKKTGIHFFYVYTVIRYENK